MVVSSHEVLEVVSGYGTMLVEFLEEILPMDAIIVPDDPDLLACVKTVIDEKRPTCKGNRPIFIKSITKF